VLRFLGWLAVGVGGLIVLSVLFLLSARDEQQEQLRGAIQKVAMDMAGGGQGFDDGALVWRETEPYRITIEQLPTLEGRRLGTRISGGLLADRMSWYGVSLRAAIGRCLSFRTDRVLGDALLDGLWLDVDAARPHGMLWSGMDEWEPVHQRILQGLLESYDLTLHIDREVRDLAIIEAGPGWAEHLVQGRRRRTSISTGSGLLTLKGMPVGRLLHQVQQELGALELVDIRSDDICNLELQWKEGDSESLIEALADQLDLHVLHEERELEVAIVVGVPKAKLASEG